MGLLFVFDKDKSDIESTTGQTNLLRKVIVKMYLICHGKRMAKISANTVYTHNI